MRQGNCYVTCEALYHLLGGKDAGWTPHSVRHRGVVHWYLVHAQAALVLDPTRYQFPIGDPPPYHEGRGRGFLTRRPSKRARQLMEAMLWQ